MYNRVDQCQSCDYIVVCLKRCRIETYRWELWEGGNLLELQEYKFVALAAN